MFRTPWAALPAELRAAVEACTGPVDREVPSQSGINSQISSALHTVQGRVFVKGAKDVVAGQALKGLEIEAAISPHVSALAPRLLFDVEAEGWRLLGYEHVDGRPIDYAPGSPDLPKLADLIHRLQQTPRPAAVTPPFERRWSELGDAGVMAGDALLHTDFNTGNVLVTGERAYLIDWAWSCKGAAWVDLAFLVVRLINAGHTPSDAERWASGFPAWASAPPEGIDTFTRLHLQLWKRAAQRAPRPSWGKLADTAKTWADYRRF